MKTNLLFLSLVLVTVSPSQGQDGTVTPTKPHLIFMLVDDNGWAGVGYNNPYLNTPTIDNLAKAGLTLTSQYVYKYCSPSRGSFLTGRYPYKLAGTRTNFIPFTLQDGIHLSYAMLPKKLKTAGYYSVHVGKWHQGHYTPLHTPVGRGFDESLGFLEGGEDHNTSQTIENYCNQQDVDLTYNQMSGTGKSYPYTWSKCTWRELAPDMVLHSKFDVNSTDIPGYNPYVPLQSTEEGCKQVCENRVDCVGYSYRVGYPNDPHYQQCFLVSSIGGQGVQHTGFQSAVCERPQLNTTMAASDKNGTYTGIVFNEKAVEVLENHAANKASVPLFMYYALHNTHWPFEAPWRYIAPYAAQFPKDPLRATWSGMVSFVDEALLNISNTLHSTGLWNNTLLVFTMDNGSPVNKGGSNNPLKGGKGSNFEGGTRVPAFVTGGILPSTQAGKTHNGLIHISDWHATFCALAGVNTSTGEPNAVSSFDGIDAWPWISGEQENSNRYEIVYDHNMFRNSSRGCANYPVNHSDGRSWCVSAAIQQSGWKLIIGKEGSNDWFGWFSPNTSVPYPKRDTLPNCSPNPCLYNLNDSITEHINLASDNPQIVEMLLKRVDELSYTYHPPIPQAPDDLPGYCAAVTMNKGFVGPWMAKPESDFNNTIL
eukprot:m.40106 g.40106  ORF g.40106 m.40106 type:complete len:650 (+) comp9628_c0_seq1:92-2041(+)